MQRPSARIKYERIDQCRVAGHRLESLPQVGGVTPVELIHYRHREGAGDGLRLDSEQGSGDLLALPGVVEKHDGHTGQQHRQNAA
jgi:hypothetical protein